MKLKLFAGIDRNNSNNPDKQTHNTSSAVYTAIKWLAKTTRSQARLSALAAKGMHKSLSLHGPWEKGKPFAFQLTTNCCIAMSCSKTCTSIYLQSSANCANKLTRTNLYPDVLHGTYAACVCVDFFRITLSCLAPVNFCTTDTIYGSCRRMHVLSQSKWGKYYIRFIVLAIFRQFEHRQRKCI